MDHIGTGEKRFKDMTVHGTLEGLLALALERPLPELEQDGDRIMVNYLMRLPDTQSGLMMWNTKQIPFKELKTKIEALGWFGFIRDEAHLHVWFKDGFDLNTIAQIIREDLKVWVAC